MILEASILEGNRYRVNIVDHENKNRRCSFDFNLSNFEILVQIRME